MSATKIVRRMPTVEMVEAGRKATEPEKFVSHARAIWVWQAMHDAAPTEPDARADYVPDTDHGSTDDA